jgi:hypothetical protein
MAQTDYISQAKAYLRERLSAEISFQNNLETLIEEYAYKLVDIAYNANVPPNMFTFSYSKAIKEDVDEVIGEMKQLIVSVTETLAIGTHNDNKKKILTYIGRDISGSNFYGRLDNHTDTFKKVTEGIIAAGLLIGASKSKTFAGYKQYLRNPFLNPIFKDAVKMNAGRAEVLLNKGLHIGVGVSNSPFNAINTLGRYTIGDAWMYDGYLEMDAQGAIGYRTMRTSSYPCEDCDEAARYTHSLSEGMILPLHVNCRCIAVPVFRNEI